MGFFRKKRPTIDEQAPEPAAEPAGAAEPLAAKPAPPAPTPAPPKLPSYGIDDAIKLMRDLPATENIELVVQVIKRTLESTRVDVAAIIEDGITKQHSMENQVKTLEREIAALQQELAQRREEIAALKADHEETRQVRERLLASKTLGLSHPAPQPTPQPTPQPRATSGEIKKTDDGWGEDTDVPVTVDAGAVDRRAER